MNAKSQFKSNPGKEIHNDHSIRFHNKLSKNSLNFFLVDFKCHLQPSVTRLFSRIMRNSASAALATAKYLSENIDHFRIIKEKYVASVIKPK